MLTSAQTFPDTEDHPTGCAVAGWLWSVKKKKPFAVKKKLSHHPAVRKAGEAPELSRRESTDRRRREGQGS